MSASELLPASRHLAASASRGSCPVCLVRERTTVLVSSPKRSLKECRECGVTFLEPQPDVREFSSILSDHYIKDEARLERAFEKTRDPVASLVAKKIQERKKRGRILDVGCAGGYFLSRYFPSTEWELFGVEPSKFASARAAEKGVRVYNGELTDQDLPGGCFDVITILDTFSYFREPREELNVLHRTMKAGALLAIEQPLAGTHVWRHATRLGRFLGGAPMSLLESGQNFLYTMSSMILLLRETGFEIVECLPLPGNKQRDLYRDVLFGVYYTASRIIWGLSGETQMWGPNFVVIASPVDKS